MPIRAAYEQLGCLRLGNHPLADRADAARSGPHQLCNRAAKAFIRKPDFLLLKARVKPHQGAARTRDPLAMAPLAEIETRRPPTGPKRKRQKAKRRGH